MKQSLFLALMLDYSGTSYNGYLFDDWAGAQAVCHAFQNHDQTEE